MAESDIGREFSDPRFRRSKAVRFAVIIVLLAFLVGSMSASDTGPVTIYIGVVAAMIAFLGVGLFRTFDVGIRLTDECVEVRTTYATRRWTWETIVRARAHDQTVRSSPYTTGLSKASKEQRARVYPTFDLTDGRDVRLYGLQTMVRDLADGAWIDQAVLAINRVAAVRRGEPDPSVARPR